MSVFLRSVSSKSVLAPGADDDSLDVLVVVYAGHLVVVAQHVLVQQITQSQIVRVIADRHHRDDLLPVEEERQRAFLDDTGLYRRAVLVHAVEQAREASVVRIRLDRECSHGRRVPRPSARFQNPAPGSYSCGTLRY